MTGDVYIGRSRWCKHVQSMFLRTGHSDSEVLRFLTVRFSLRHLSWSRLVCHRTPDQTCHGDVIVSAFRFLFPSAFDRDDPTTGPPSSMALEYLATLREEPEEDGVRRQTKELEDCGLARRRSPVHGRHNVHSQGVLRRPNVSFPQEVADRSKTLHPEQTVDIHFEPLPELRKRTRFARPVAAVRIGQSTAMPFLRGRHCRAQAPSH